MNPSADAKLDPTVGACLPPSQLLLFPEVLRRPLEFTQYTSVAFGGRCKQAGVRPSMGSVGDCYDNAMSESFFATLECELIDRYRFKTQAEARMAVFGFIEGWYNPRRRHSSLGYESPISFEENHANRSAACPAAAGTATFNEPGMLLLPCASGAAEASDSKGSWEKRENTST